MKLIPFLLFLLFLLFWVNPLRADDPPKLSERNTFFSNRSWFEMGRIPSTLAIGNAKGTKTWVNGQLVLEYGYLKPLPRLLNATEAGTLSLGTSLLLGIVGGGMVTSPSYFGPLQIGSYFSGAAFCVGAICLGGAGIFRTIPEKFYDTDLRTRLYFIRDNSSGKSEPPINLQFRLKRDLEMDLETLVHSSRLRLAELPHTAGKNQPVELIGVNLGTTQGMNVVKINAVVRPLEENRLGEEHTVELTDLSVLRREDWNCWGSLRALALKNNELK